jgi:hypothetical protein
VPGYAATKVDVESEGIDSESDGPPSLVGESDEERERATASVHAAAATASFKKPKGAPAPKAKKMAQPKVVGLVQVIESS